MHVDLDVVWEVGTDELTPLVTALRPIVPPAQGRRGDHGDTAVTER